MAPQERATAGPAGAAGATGATGATGVVKKKRVVTTAADRERLKLRAEDVRWNAAKTPEAKAWINSTRLLKEFLTSGEDVLSLKAGPATRRDLWAKADAMGLHVEMFDTRASKDVPPQGWIVLGRVAARMAVAGKVRDIQRQNKRQLQEDEDEAEAEDEDGDATEAGADKTKTSADLIDPSLREQRAPVAQMMLPGGQQASDVRQQLPAIDYAPKSTTNNKTAQTSLPNADIEAAKQLSVLKSQAGPARPVFRKDPLGQAAPKPADALPQEITKEQPATDETTETDRIANWVSQQVESAQTEKDVVDPTGNWKITCEAIAEQLGEMARSDTMNLTIHLEPTRPQSDNDSDDSSPATVSVADVPESELTEAQKARLGTYQLWATFNLGLFEGVIRFMSPTTLRTTPTQRTSFDLLPSQLPSPENRTFQYKWRGREVSDSVITVEAEEATQFIRFEEDGVKMTGVFECEYLGETGFEGQKVGKAEAAKEGLGKLWSQLSPQAHDMEAQQNA
ncbi:hypothetical protein M436DRAFT_41282 [Aureobasidium namibiae CBS 147.97]|uniref:Uncharacterized protein n=1 Tax=Aureobasidium namibiae CBS 147.97 TaxID=1043004 RepID=A0A074WQ38_9PEZI